MAYDPHCDDCGHLMQVGEHPFCPHPPFKNASGSYKGHTDDLSFEKTETFSTKGDFEGYLKRNKLEVRGHNLKRSDKGRWV